jgi:thymidylate synthase (FAD)
MSESDIVFKSDVTVELVKASASDADVIWAARVSTAGEQSMDEIGEDPARSEGLINYLARERHGSPLFLSSANSCATVLLHITKRVVDIAN